MADELEFDSAFVKATRNFAAITFAQLLKNKLEATSNVFFSPISISIALAALHRGATANTARQIESVLGLSETDAAKLPQEIKQFLLQLRGYESDGNTEQSGPLRVANALAVQNKYHVEEDYLETLRKEFSSELMCLDFVKDIEASRRTLNSWISDRTAQMIKELLQPGVLCELTRLVIVNAVHFDGAWIEAFDEQQTEPATFSLLTEQPSTVQVRMMTRKATRLSYWTNVPNPDFPEAPTPYSDVVQLSLVSLPYVRKGRDSIEMLILLPDDRDGLRRLETLLASTPEALSTFLTTFRENARRRDVKVKLPKFRFTENLPLKDLLGQLGATDMFGDNADFSGISKSDGKQLYVSEAVHQAVIDVDEKGTRAAAATAVAMNLRCMPMHEPPVEFTVDHPCMFVLCNPSLGIPLFIGRLAQPKYD